jgi:hypothetical protein
MNTGRRGRDCMVLDLHLPIQSVTITTNVVSSNPTHGEVYSIQHYAIKFVSDLQQVRGFLRILWFPPLIKLMVYIVESGVKHHSRNHSNDIQYWVMTYNLFFSYRQ